MSEPGVRVTVERAAEPRCGLAVGDFFEVYGSTLIVPSGKPFCLYAMTAVLPLLMAKMSDPPEDDWLSRKPFICCPDSSDEVLMRLDLVELAES